MSQHSETIIIYLTMPQPWQQETKQQRFVLYLEGVLDDLASPGLNQGNMPRPLVS